MLRHHSATAKTVWFEWWSIEISSAVITCCTVVGRRPSTVNSGLNIAALLPGVVGVEGNAWETAR